MTADAACRAPEPAAPSADARYRTLGVAIVQRALAGVRLAGSSGPVATPSVAADPAAPALAAPCRIREEAPSC